MYYLWLNEAQAGPYALEQVQLMWKAGTVVPQTLYWQEGNAEWQPLSSILSEIEPKKKEAMPARTAVIRPKFEQTIVQRTGNLDRPKAVPQVAQQPAPTRSAPEPVPSTKQPTLRKWAPVLVVGVILIVVVITVLIYFL